MKSLFSALVLAFVIMTGTAQAVEGNIRSLFCQGGELGVGYGSVTFTGHQTFNITETNGFGIPFTQQATVKSVDFDGKIMTFRLYGTITGLTYTLKIKQGTSSGVMSTVYGSMNLTCRADIDVN